MKKILVTASTFPRWKNDTEPRFVLDLSKNLTDEYDVTVLAPASEGALDVEDMEGVHVIRYHYFPIHKWETLCYPGAIVPRIKEKKIRILLVPFMFVSLGINLLKLSKSYDIVHAHWLIPQGIVQSFFKTKYIVTGHGGDVTSLNNGIMRKLKARCIRNASAVTVVSEHLKKTINEISPESNEPVIISMGVDNANFGKQYRKENYFHQGNKKVILFVGRLAEKKGVRYLISSMKYIQNSILYIVGDGPLRTELEDMAKSIDAEIVFAGSKTHAELKEIYASADVFVAPSVTAKDGDQEGLGLVMLEAMASGLPVVASRSGGIVQVIRNEVNGLLCEEKNVYQIAESINRIFKDDELRNKLLKGSQNTAAQYDYKVQAGKYKDLIKHIIDTN